MTQYRNLTVDFPSRIHDLDVHFRPIALGMKLEVTYAIMKLASAFLLPYERIDGQSGAKRADVSSGRDLRRALGLGSPFDTSRYCADPEHWACFTVPTFPFDVDSWAGVRSTPSQSTATILETMRHAIAHSNLLFAGCEDIELVFMASRDGSTGGCRVVRCTGDALNNFADRWIENLATLPTCHGLVWNVIESHPDDGEDGDGPFEELSDPS